VSPKRLDIWLGRITAAQSGWGVRGSNPEPTD
jgi:hypothetical protein